MILDSLHKFIEYLQSERHVQDASRVDALNAINRALNQTKQYVEFTGGEKCADRAKEYELAQLWDEASAAVLKIRDVSDDFAIALHAKALYWSGIPEWSAEEAKEKKIQFDQIEEQIDKLLGGGT